MISQVLRIPPHELSYSHIEELVNSGRAEGQHIDFKKQAPAGNRLARAFTSMANGGGGLIIFGVDAPNLRATSIEPVPLDATITDIENTLAEKVEPIMLPNFYPLPRVANSDLGVVLAEIPQSEFVPYATKLGLGNYKFDRRVGQRSVPMSESMIESMYRDRFFRTQQLSDRLETLAPSGERHLSDAGHIIVAGVPVLRTRVFSPSTLNVADLVESIEELHPRPIFDLNPYGQGFSFIADTSPKVRYRRITVRDAENGEWSFYDDGSFSNRIRPIMLAPGSPGDRPYFHFTTLVTKFLAALSSYWALASYFGISGELILRVGLYGSRTKLAKFPGKENPDIDGRIEGGNYSDHSFSLTDLQVGSSLIRTAKPLLDDVFAGFGVGEGCTHITPSGKLHVAEFDVEIQKDAYRWAVATSVPLTELSCKVLEANPDFLKPEA